MNTASVTEKNLHSRSRAKQSEFRKQQLIEATIDCIDKLGLSQTTLAHIAKHAGVSQGNIIFHFRSKELLLEHALRHLSEEYLRCWKGVLAETEKRPIEKLCALIAVPFRASICSRKKISVWFAFWGETRSRPIYMSLCGEHDRAFTEAVGHACQELEQNTTATLSADSAAITIQAMIDGLWLNFLVGPPGFNRQQAIQKIFQLIEIIYPEKSVTIREFVENS